MASMAHIDTLSHAEMIALLMNLTHIISNIGTHRMPVFLHRDGKYFAGMISFRVVMDTMNAEACLFYEGGNDVVRVKHVGDPSDKDFSQDASRLLDTMKDEIRSGLLDGTDEYVLPIVLDNLRDGTPTDDEMMAIANKCVGEATTSAVIIN